MKEDKVKTGRFAKKEYKSLAMLKKAENVNKDEEAKEPLLNKKPQTQNLDETNKNIIKNVGSKVKEFISNFGKKPQGGAVEEEKKEERPATSRIVRKSVTSYNAPRSSVKSVATTDSKNSSAKK